MPKVRYNLADAFMTRNGVPGEKDAYVQNACADKYGKKTYVIKRPGTVLAQAFDGLGIPKGVFLFNDIFYQSINGQLLLSTAQNTGTDGTAWSASVTPTWSGRYDFASTVFLNRMWVINGFATGGGFGSGASSDIWSTPDGVTWTPNAGGAPWVTRLGAAACVFNNKMYFMGGEDLNAVTHNDVWVTSDGQNWEQVLPDDAAATDRWSPRDFFGLVATSSGMYVMGGDSFGTGITLLNDVWFSVDGKVWSQVNSAASWSGRAAFGCLFFHNKIFVIGGEISGSAFGEDDVWSSPDGLVWTLETATAFPTGRWSFGATVYNDKMWVSGGLDTTGPPANYLTDVYSSPDGATWTLVTNTPGWTARAGHAMLTFRTPHSVSEFNYQSMWVLGGLNYPTFYQEVWYGNLNVILDSSYFLGDSDYINFTTYMNGTKLLMKTSTHAWVLESGTLTRVTDVNYPSLTVPGFVVLNAFAYVMTPQGEIHSNKLDDPLTWPALQFLTADYEDDPGVALAKYLNYVVAFGTYTMQFFYDNGANQPVGTALAPYQNANTRVGCAAARTIQNVGDTLIWLGQDEDRHLAIYILDGMTPKKISNSWVERQINEQFASIALVEDVYALTTGSAGHNFYVLSFGTTAGPSLVYDVANGFWQVWTDFHSTVAFPAPFPYTFALSSLTFGVDILVDFRGNLFYTSFDYYQDDPYVVCSFGGRSTGPFPMVVQTDKLDDGSLERKFFGFLDFVSDVNESTVCISYTDDDYQTFSKEVSLSLNQMRPRINRQGSSRRRAYNVLQQDNEPARWEAIELTYSKGES